MPNRFGRIHADETPRCIIVSASASIRAPYGHKDTQSEPRRRGETSETCAANQGRGRVARAWSSKPAMGGCDAAPHDSGGKNRAVAFHDVSRDVHFDGFGCVRTNAARCERSSRGRIYSRYADHATGHREKPDLPVCCVEQSIADAIEIAAADRSGLRTWVGDAPR